MLRKRALRILCRSHKFLLVGGKKLPFDFLPQTNEENTNSCIDTWAWGAVSAMTFGDVRLFLPHGFCYTEWLRSRRS